MADINKHLTYHSSRRTFATLASAKGVSLQDLKQYMGHSSSKTTERYIKWSPTLAEQSAKKVKLFYMKELLKNSSTRRQLLLQSKSKITHFIVPDILFIIFCTALINQS